MGSWDKMKWKTYDDSQGRGNAEDWKGAFKKRMKIKIEGSVGSIGEFPEMMDADSEVALKKAYRKLSKIHHPDKGGDIEKFKALNAMYEKLRRTFL